MNAAELRSYEQQLAQVQGALATDGQNEGLLTLKKELQNLIDLTRQLLGNSSDSNASTSSAPPKGPPAPTVLASAPAAAPPAPAHKYVVGEECQALYEADRRHYPARIIAIAGSTQSPMYTILFKGYNETAIVPATSLRPSKTASATASSAHTQTTATHALGDGSSSKKHGVRLSAEEEAEQERKRRRSEKKADRYANRTAEVNAVQNSWQKFAKKAEKKGVMKRGSMFKTPDDPLAKVGVTGAGRGMTQYGDRKKHWYDEENDEAKK